MSLQNSISMMFNVERNIKNLVLFEFKTILMVTGSSRVKVVCVKSKEK